jgi:hypothetical protein
MKLSELEVLIDEIEEDTRFTSNLEKMKAHDNFNIIVAEGKDAVPLLLRLLRRKGSWTPLFLLMTITGASPVKKENAGRYDLIIKDWLEWGAANGY